MPIETETPPTGALHEPKSPEDNPYREYHEALVKVAEVYDTVKEIYQKGSEELHLKPHDPNKKPYHNFEHNEDVFTTANDVCFALGRAGRPLSDENYKLVLSAAILHDIGYLGTTNTKEEYSERFEFYGIPSSKDGILAQEVLEKMGWSLEDRLMARDMIFALDNPELVDKGRFSPKVEYLAKILNAADLLGQCANPNYLEKLPYLRNELWDMTGSPDIIKANTRSFIADGWLEDYALPQTEWARKLLNKAGIVHYEKNFQRNLSERKRFELPEARGEVTYEKALAEANFAVETLEKSGVKIKAVILRGGFIHPREGTTYARKDNKYWPADYDVLVLTENDPQPLMNKINSIPSPFMAKPEVLNKKGEDIPGYLKLTREEFASGISKQGQKEMGVDVTVYHVDSFTKLLKQEENIPLGDENIPSYSARWLLKDAFDRGKLIRGEIPQVIKDVATKEGFRFNPANITTPSENAPEADIGSTPDFAPKQSETSLV